MCKSQNRAERVLGKQHKTVVLGSEFVYESKAEIEGQAREMYRSNEIRGHLTEGIRLLQKLDWVMSGGVRGEDRVLRALDQLEREVKGKL